jgi:hypothetical protein
LTERLSLNEDAEIIGNLDRAPKVATIAYLAQNIAPPEFEQWYFNRKNRRLPLSG